MRDKLTVAKRWTWVWNCK